ncbi:MAG: nitroreductase family protein [Candidatus Thorarchaeota archaeon]
MNEVLRVIDNRRSLRGYAPREISDEHKKWILHSAFRAPTAGNMMMYSIIEVADQELKDRLVTTCDNQPFIAKAPLVLLFLADMQRWYDFFEHSGVPDMCRERGVEYVTPKESDLLLACCDALAAAQNAVIAAESLGIGSCYIGDIMENIEIHREMFDLPKWVFPIALLCFGYPLRDDRHTRERTSRFSQHFVYFKNKYRRVDAKAFESEFAERFKGMKDLGEGVANVGQLLYLRKTGSDFAREMRRSVRVALDDWVA